MDQIGVFSPEQARLLWQDYQARQQLASQLTKNYPQRRPLDEPSPHRVFVLNSDSYEAIPPYACMEVTGTQVYAGRTVITVEKPTTLDGEYLFNSPYQIEAGAAGWAYRFGVVVMLGAAPSAPNVSYQPIVDSWEIEEGGGPFTVFGEFEITPESETAALIGRFAVGAGGGNTMWFDITEVVCADDYTPESYLLVEWTYFSGGCSTPPGANYDGTYNVYDICGYMGIPENLTATKGRATYMYPRDGYCEPRWIIDDLCYEPRCV